MNILLVDDDESNLVTLAALLEDEGFKVLFARSCEEARAVLDEGPVLDWALVDLNLADGSGLTLVPLLRARVAGAKVGILTGDPHAAEGAQVNAVLPKGLPFQELLAALAT